MARPKTFKNSIVIGTRLEPHVINMLDEIVTFENSMFNRKITSQELIRNAITFVYSDNERLRECFRRSRGPMTKKFYKNP